MTVMINLARLALLVSFIGGYTTSPLPEDLSQLLPAFLTPDNITSSSTTCDSNYAFTHQNGSNVDVFATLNISSPDGSAHASFIALGASVTNFYVKDREGVFRDVILGYDNRTQYLTDPAYSYFGPIVGRYANRIRNSSFSIPPEQDLSKAKEGTVYHVTPNENDGRDTLHGGVVGTSRSGFTLIKHTPHELVFGLLDKNNTEGFPGTMYAKITYRLANHAKWIIEFDAHAFEPTPILLSSHVYWNLDGYQGDMYSDNSVNSILKHELSIKASRYIEGDGILIPTGVIGSVDAGSSPFGAALDFRTKKAIGAQFDETLNLCGTGCTGYDTAFIYDDHTVNDEVLTLSSSESGIKLSVRTDQTSAQIYSCSGQKGQIPRKESQGGPSKSYDQFSCLVIEQQGWIGGINQPEWGQDQVYTPERPYKWYSEYTFTNDA